MQFTYTFPPLFIWGFYVRRDGYSADGAWSLVRGLNSGRWWFKWFNLIIGLAALSMAALGMYGSGISIKETFEVGAATSFGCTPPV